jgi:hypothetical protein
MADREVDTGAPPNPAPGGITRIVVIVLAALVVIAVIAWFVMGSQRAPGPAADGQQMSGTEARMADTVITQPNGQVTTAGARPGQAGVIEAPPITSNGGPVAAAGPANFTPNAAAANTAR